MLLVPSAAKSTSNVELPVIPVPAVGSVTWRVPLEMLRFEPSAIDCVDPR